MKPVCQTIPGGPHDDPAKRGNCYQAVIASILELRIEEVPHFVAIEGDGWWDCVQEFMGQFGLQLEWVDVTDNPEYRELRPKGYWIASVKSPRGDWNHCLVMKGDTIVHDPFPGAPRSERLDPDRLVLIEWFTSLDPSIAVRGARA